MSKTIIVKDIAQYEENDSELAKYTIATLQYENEKLKDENGVLKLKLEECKAGCKRFYEDKIEMQYKIDKAIYFIKNESWFSYKDNEPVVSVTSIDKLIKILKN